MPRAKEEMLTRDQANQAKVTLDKLSDQVKVMKKGGIKYDYLAFTADCKRLQYIVDQLFSIVEY